MAVDIIYIDEGRGVIIRAYDEVNGKDLIKAYEKVYQQHKIINQDYHIMDNSWCSEYNVTANDIKFISAIDYKTVQLNSDIIKAVIESSMLSFSLTQLWQAHIESFLPNSKSFSNQMDALVWIREMLLEKLTLEEAIK